jgi:hypothetical protein
VKVQFLAIERGWCLMIIVQSRNKLGSMFVRTIVTYILVTVEAGGLEWFQLRLTFMKLFPEDREQV